MCAGSRIAAAAAAVAMALDPASAATRLTPAEIQSLFFTGQPFTAATPSNIQFKMVFMPDGKMTREPVGKAGVRDEGTWKLSKDGFCTTWRASAQNCFTLMSSDNKWSVMKGTALVAVWTR
jgi:hypothetical protein